MSDTQSQSENQPTLPQRPALLLLAALWILAAPLFVCSPVTSDTSLFDVQAMTVLKGGVLSRDVLEPNLPGIVWLHLAVRSLVGWSSEAIRAVDLVIFAATLLVFCSFISSPDRRHPRRQWPLVYILLCSLFYLTRNEWCHCQRDIWMLLPVDCALGMRFRVR